MEGETFQAMWAYSQISGDMCPKTDFLAQTPLQSKFYD